MYGGVLAVSGVVPRLPQRNIEIMWRVGYRWEEESGWDFLRGVALYAYGGVLKVSDVVLRLPQRRVEIMRRVKDLSGELGTVGKRRAGGTL